MLYFLLAISDQSDHDKIIYIYNTFHTKMLKYARAALNGENRTFNEEDAVQNVYLGIILYSKSIKCWDDEKQLYAYLLRSLSHECLHVREGATYVADIDEYAYTLVSDEDIVAKVNETENYNRLVAKIMELDERYSIPMHLYWVEELEVKDIAKRLNLPNKTIYTRLERGKYMLMKLLEKEDAHEGS